MNPINLFSSPLQEIDKLNEQRLQEKEGSEQDVDLSAQLNSLFLSELVISQIADFEGFSCYNELIENNGKLVKLTYMVQNIDDPEVYAHGLLSKSAAGESKIINLKYRENLGVEVTGLDLENDCLLSERLNVYCVPIPGLNSRRGTTSANSGMMMENTGSIKYQEVEIDTREKITGFFEKLKSKGIFNSENPNGFPAILKVYDSNRDLIKMNEVYEIVGILSYNPEEPSPEPSETFDGIAVQYPASLVPRIHCVGLRKLAENELESRELTGLSLKFESLAMKDLQAKTLGLFNLITNDELVSLYILLGLLNNNPQKSGSDYMESVKKLVVNVFNVPRVNSAESGFPGLFARIFARITTKSVYLPLDIGFLETSLFSPVKDYSRNRLDVGKLQITGSSVLLVDETRMSEGKLTERGIKNLQNLNNLLENQSVLFDFSYQQVSIPCACNALILSEGKSFLKANINIPMEKDPQALNLPPELSEFLSKDSLEDCGPYRYFLLKSQQNLLSVKISEEVAKLISEDYVESRKSVPSMDIESLQLWIIIAKAFSAMEGLSELPFSQYLRAKELEALRGKRLSLKKC